jgi:probable rRNA maturation factor
MEEYTSEIEFSINTGNEESDSTVHELLSSLSLEELLERTLRAVSIMQPAILTLIVTDDATIQSLNKRYRQQDKPTDVLSFPLPDKPLVDAPADQLWTFAESQNSQNREEIEAVRSTPTFVTPSELPTNLGDIVISWPTIVRQAAEAGHTAAYEMLYLFAHGILHLVGYDDATEAGYTAMVNLQRAVLETMGWKAQGK